MSSRVKALEVVLLFSCALLATNRSLAQHDIDEVLGGFDDDGFGAESTVEVSDVADSEERAWTLSGSLQYASAYSYLAHDAPGVDTEYGGVSKLQLKGSLQLDIDLPYDWKARTSGYAFYDFVYRVRGREDYTRQVLDEYEWDLQLEETYLHGVIGEYLELKLGRQIVNWGRSDSLRVLDVLNPLDLRQPFQTDIDNQRLAVTMARVSLNFGSWSLTGIAIPEIRSNLTAPFGSDFFPAAGPPPPQDRPKDWSSDTEWGAELTGIFRGWDLSLNVARFFDDVPTLRVSSLSNPTPPPTSLLVPTALHYDRLTLVGAGGNLIHGSWLFKAELAWLDGLGFADGRQRSRIDFMGGIEYYGFANRSISLEMVTRHINDFEPGLGGPFEDVDRNSFETAFRYTAELFNSRLDVTFLLVAFGLGGKDGSSIRATAAYEVRDGLVMEGGLLLFQKGDDYFDSIARNDRIFASIKYSF